MKDKDVMKRAEKAHYQLNNVLAKEQSDFVFVYDDIIEDFFWNYAGIIQTENTEALLESINDYYVEKNRAPAAYITPYTEPDDLEEILKDKSFELMAQDAWMFYEGEKIDQNNESGLEFIEVANNKEIEKFVELFQKAYGGSNDEEAYGELPEYYSEAQRELITNNHEGKTFRAIIGEKSGEHVAIGILIHDREFAGIYSIGVDPDHRGNGFGTAIMNFLVEEAQKAGVKNIFLQTEKGSKNEQFFSNRGFNTEFTGKIFVKE